MSDLVVLGFPGGASTSDAVAVVRGSHRIGELLGGLTGFDPGTLAESVTWSFTPDPLVLKGSNGQEIYRVSGMKLTKVRAPLTTGGYKAYVTLTYQITSAGWHTNAPYDPVAWWLDMTNTSGGVLDRFEGKFNLRCGQNDSVFLSKDINPDIYDLMQGATHTFGEQTFYHC